jgi:hypothetical protein
MDRVQHVFDRLDEATDALAEVHRVIAAQPDVDITENGNLRLLRRLQELIGQLHDEIEDTGLTGDE